MKFLIDNNLSYKLTELLNPAGIDASHIKKELSIFSFDRDHRLYLYMFRKLSFAMGIHWERRVRL